MYSLCGECGAVAVLYLCVEGRVTPYRDTILPIPEDFPIRTCQVCQSEWFDRAEAEAMDLMLEQQYENLAPQ
jgi:hypothetical protein